MTSCAFLTYAYAFVGGSWEKWGLWGEMMGGEAREVTDYVFRCMCENCGGHFPPFKSRCYSDHTLDANVQKEWKLLFRAPVLLICTMLKATFTSAFLCLAITFSPHPLP